MKPCDQRILHCCILVFGGNSRYCLRLFKSNEFKSLTKETKMKKTVLFSAAAVVLALSVNAADSTTKDDVNAAAKKLAETSSYSWRTTVAVPEDAPFKPGPTDGKAEKD